VVGVTDAARAKPDAVSIFNKIKKPFSFGEGLF
jgi:hypothetical protein